MSDTGVNPEGAKDFVRRITRLLARGDGEPYAFPAHAPAKLGAWIEEAASGPDAVAIVGAALKLVSVLRTKHRSPAAADTLTRALQSSPTAMRVIALHWSSGRRAPRVGADLLPVKTELAPHVEARPEAGAVTAGSLMRPGQDLRGSHLQRKKIMRRKS